MLYDVVVIGAGLGGLSAGIALAAQGKKVCILEKNSRAGGKMDEVHLGAYRFDTGPSLMTMKFVLDTLFQSAGKKTEDYLDLIPLPIICRYFYPDGTQVDALPDVERMAAQLPEKLRADQKALLRYMEYSKRIYDLTADLFLFDSIQNPKHLLNPKAWNTLWNIRDIDAFRTVHAANTAFFSTPHLQQLFDRYATYNGSDPYQAPATLNIIPHVEYTLGSWYVKGGIYRITEALIRLAESLNIDIQYDTPVSQIQHDGKQVLGLSTQSGESIACKHVVSNADVVHTFSHLIQGFPKKTKRLQQAEPSCSGLVFLWAMNRTFPELAHHNILFSADYETEFRQIFKAGTAPTDPTVYISITAKSDPEHAPEGCENWFVLVNMPWIENGKTNTQEEIEGIRQAIFRKAKAMGLGDIEAHIVAEQIISPSDLRDKTLTNKGSIYGLSSNDRNAAFKRQDNIASELKGLYFAGGSAHPGGGMPLALLSGMNAAKWILKSRA
jgi:diapolycopene oxygenase